MAWLMKSPPGYCVGLRKQRRDRDQGEVCGEAPVCLAIDTGCLQIGQVLVAHREDLNKLDS